MTSKPLAGSFVILLCVSLVTAQTKVTPPDNKYTPAEDAELGQKAAAEARRQLPIMRDERVHSYVANLGDRIVDRVSALLDDPVEYASHQIDKNPYGDGRAAERIVDLMLKQEWTDQ